MSEKAVERLIDEMYRESSLSAPFGFCDEKGCTSPAAIVCSAKGLTERKCEKHWQESRAGYLHVE